MKRILIAVILLPGASWAQNGGVIPPPDIVHAAGEIAEAPAKAQAEAAQTALLRQQAALLKQQAELLKQQAALKQHEQSDTDFDQSGNEFLRVCDDEGKEVVTRTACLGYVIGVIDGLETSYDLFTSVTASKPARLLCIRPEVTATQELNIVAHYVKDHPREADGRTSLLIFNAMFDAFRCQSAAVK